MSGIEHTREDLEHLWKERLEDVKTRLDFATQHLKEIGDGSGTIPPSDSRESAIRVYTEALAEYVNTSKIYQDLVLHGKVPDEGHRRCA